MKICYVADAKSPHTFKWVKHFVDRGHEIALLSFNEASSQLGEAGIRVLSLTATNRQNGAGILSKEVASREVSLPRRLFRTWYGRLPENLRLVESLEACVQRGRQFIREFRPDVVHGHFLTNHGYIAARVGFNPLIVSAWGSDVLVKPSRSFVMKTVLRYTMSRADLITANSTTLADQMLQYGANPRKVVAFPWGIDPSVFYSREWSRGEDDGRCKVFCPRTLEPVYNVELIIRSIPHLLGSVPNVNVFLAGNGRLRAGLEDLAKRLGVDEHITFLDWLGLEELAARYRNSDIYLSTSFSDSTSLSLLEAMASGAFPVVSDLPGNREWIHDGENGFLVPVDDPRLLADRIALAYRNIELRDSAAIRNARIIRERGEWATSAQKMESCYRTLLSLDSLERALL